jgi:hypothetical protein
MTLGKDRILSFERGSFRAKDVELVLEEVWTCLKTDKNE